MSEITGVTVLIPFRNEAIHLPTIIDALEKQIIKENIEIIWIDDASEDDGRAIVMKAVDRNSQWKCLTREGAPGKKFALHTGVSAARYNYILTTDADSYMDTTWLQNAHSVIREHPLAEMIILPVVVQPENHFLSQLQYAESLHLLALNTIMSSLGCPVLCNGANLIFRKSFYTSAYTTRNDFHIASGDDMFLLDKAEKVAFVASKGLVTTQPTNDWQSFVHQRIRWFGKVRHLKGPRFFAVGVLVGIWQFALYLWLLAAWYFGRTWAPCVIFTCAKISIDGISQWLIARKLNQRFYMLSTFSYSLLYPILQLVILFLRIFIQPTWKGRAIDR